MRWNSSVYLLMSHVDIAGGRRGGRLHSLNGEITLFVMTGAVTRRPCGGSLSAGVRSGRKTRA